MTAAAQHRMATRPRPPMFRRTVRLRLTLLYGLLFVSSGAALLCITYVIVAHLLNSPLQSSPSGTLRHTAAPTHKAAGIVRSSGAQQSQFQALRLAELHELLIGSGFALAFMTVASIILGWLVAGRVLRPLRAMTAATRRISDQNLHERLALQGPDDELKDLSNTIDELLTRLDSAFESQRRFVANASHELRTPVMLTQTLLQVALANPAITLSSLQAACHDVLVTCKDQDRLIRALLILARSQRGLDHREPLDLAQIARQALHARGRQATAKGLRIDTDLRAAPVAGDPSLAAILITNLIENAIRHNIPGGHIQITADSSDGRAALLLANTGPRVPADQAQRLLEPFQRLDGKRGHDHDGHGLGLSIAAAITSAHHATLSVRPRPDGGLAIKVTFPPIADQTAAHTAAALPCVNVSGPPGLTPQLHVRAARRGSQPR